MADNKKPGVKKSKKAMKADSEGGIKKPTIRSILQENDETMKIILGSKAITIYELARKTGVKVSAVNKLIRKLENEKKIKRVGGFSGHRVYQPVA